MARPKYLQRDRKLLFEDVRQDLIDRGVTRAEAIAEMMAYRAAAFFLNGPEKGEFENDSVRVSSADAFVKQFMAKGAVDYVLRSYNNLEIRQSP